ncbi:MAG: M23 family metallopeptidase, partial [Firmicutes bacterium]|nr:M23 family metallopeptidase [Bacillota bacterium]
MQNAKRILKSIVVSLVFAALIMPTFTMVAYGDLQISEISEGDAPIDSVLMYPLASEGKVTSGFGYRDSSDTNGVGSSDHKGIDIAAEEGTEIIASEGGNVISAEYVSGYGNLVVISHEDGLETRYGHMSEINVEIGQSVVRGQQIGLVGSTGDSSGPHLHFEVLVNGIAVDPEPYLTETILPDIDFASKRLIVKGDVNNLEGEPVIAVLDDVALIQYETEEEAKAGFIRLVKNFDVEVDSIMSIAEGEVEGEPTDNMTEEEKP